MKTDTTIPTTAELASMLRELLSTCELNMDDMEPETLTVVERAQALLARAPEPRPVCSRPEHRGHGALAHAFGNCPDDRPTDG